MEDVIMDDNPDYQFPEQPEAPSPPYKLRSQSETKVDDPEQEAPDFLLQKFEQGDKVCRECHDTFTLSWPTRFTPANLQFICTRCLPPELPASSPYISNESRCDPVSLAFSITDPIRRAPGSLIVLPQTTDWGDETLWLPATIVDYNRNRLNQELALAWCDRAVWLDRSLAEKQPPKRVFFRADSHVASFPVDLESQSFCRIRLPRTLDPSAEHDPNFLPDPIYDLVFEMALPRIVSLLNDRDSLHPVVQSFHEHRRAIGGPLTAVRDAAADDRWLTAVGFQPEPGMANAMQRALGALIAKRNAEGAGRLDEWTQYSQRSYLVGSVLFQTLVLQHQLGMVWDLSGDIFCRVGSREITLDPAIVEAQAALKLMWSVSDTTLDSQFRAVHAQYDHDQAQLKVLLATKPLPGPTDPIMLSYNGRPIRTHKDLQPILEARAAAQANRGAHIRPTPTGKYGDRVAAEQDVSRDL
uniref:Uncharacterized protein n=1 Tax=Mycena chlorophos TaxID=658473 RepID=A0ABQ0KXA1_MYCCL|nr:predicted protein [Mycena chlorophos]